MVRVKSLVASALALLAATGVASAAPFATTTANEAKSPVQKIDYQRCWIEDGEEICRIVADYDDPDEDVYVEDDVYAYEPGPPIILGFGIGGGRHHGHGHGHGGHGHHR